MASLESPTVLTIRPSSSSPPLPPSPAPSRAHPRERRGPHLPSLHMVLRSLSPGSRSAGGSGVFSPESSDEECTNDRRDDSAGDSGGSPREAKESWWRGLLNRYKLVLTLENSGSVARDHLASERTFLAYARTSLAIASAGVALVQLFTLSAETIGKEWQRYARPLGAVMIGLGIYTLVVGVSRYFIVQDALIRGVYPVARVSTVLLSFALLSFIIAVFVIILAVR
ncbi:hypothetical protein BD309DRAFT_954556 [Dichomitus squalens]|nr:hypothetical protein BD309DRAFT_954556 [Dichomitus squalens]